MLNMNELVDSHCHLDFPAFDADRDELINECKSKSIGKFIVPGITRSTWPRLNKLSNLHPECFPAYGLHPYFIEAHQPTDINQLEIFIQAHHSIAIGEIGLDYYIKDTNRDKQKQIFHDQLRLAADVALPVILHVRKAHDEVIQALRRFKIKGGTVHAFNGSLQQAQHYISLGFKLGFGGALISKQARHLRKLAKDLPLQSLVLETDAPDMRSVNHYERRNTPLTLLEVRNTLVSLRHESAEQISEQTIANVKAIFDLTY